VAPTNTRDDQLLVRYLVGALPEDETERIDEQSVSDDRFAADLRIVENDLVDAYARGALSGDTLRRFEAHYLPSPGARAKVAFARTLLNYQHQHQHQAAAAPVGAPVRRWSGPAAMAIRWSLAAAAVLFLATTAYFLRENVRLRHEVVDLRANLDGRRQQLEQQLQQERSASAGTARELERAREALAQAERPSPNASASRPVVASLVLLPPMRGAAAVPTLPVPRRPGVVAVRLDLEADDFPAYRVALRDPAAGKIVWQSSNVRASRGDRTSLSIALGTDLLEPRGYTLEVIGIPARGPAEPVGNYPFKVVD
jgi:hypothetical protein